MTADTEQQAFTERFTVTFLAMIHPGDRDAWRSQAPEIARTYWDDPDTRYEGPEMCAEAEIGSMRDTS